jgi:DNA-binding MarR family transcriptional regulator
MNQMAEDAFSKTGLSPSHAFVLMEVNNQNGISIGDVAKNMFLKPSTITRLVEKLEQKKLLERNVDGRNSILLSTYEGKELHESLLNSWNELYVNYKKYLGENLAAEISDKIYQAMEKIK